MIRLVRRCWRRRRDRPQSSSAGIAARAPSAASLPGRGVARWPLGLGWRTLCLGPGRLGWAAGRARGLDSGPLGASRAQLVLGRRPLDV